MAMGEKGRRGRGPRALRTEFGCWPMVDLRTYGAKGPGESYPCMSVFWCACEIHTLRIFSRSAVPNDMLGCDAMPLFRFEIT